MREPILVSDPARRLEGRRGDRRYLGAVEKDAFHDGDPFTARIYDFSDRVSCQLVMEYYRAVVDLNRAPDDIAPENKDGVIKSHTCYDIEVYKPGCLPDEELKQQLLDRYYYPYHRQLQAWLERGRRAGWAWTATAWRPSRRPSRRTPARRGR